MKRLQVCFVGVGSIAKRHIQNLTTLCRIRGIELSIDALRRSNSRNYNEIKFRKIYTDINEIEDVYDVIFITNPTEFHLDVLSALHEKGKHFFIEKPLTSLAKMEEIKQFNCKKDSTYYIACPLRYTAVIRYLKENIRMEDVIGVRCISSSYLPDWRAGIDYRTTYSASKALGGGVSIDLIHEWDYIKYLFGKPVEVSCMMGKNSKLELDCEDCAIYMARYKDKFVELHLDYFGRKTLREIMIFTGEDTIVGDLVNSKVTWLKEDKTINFEEKRNDFQMEELSHFLDIIEGKVTNTNDMLEAYHTLKLTQGEV